MTHLYHSNRGLILGNKVHDLNRLDLDLKLAECYFKTMNIYDLVLENARVTTFNKILNKVVTENLNLGITNGKIISTDVKSTEPRKKTISLKGLSLLPGLIDTQVHFREPGMTHKEDIESGTRAAIFGGITTIFDMPNTNPTTSTKEDFQKKCDLSIQRAHCHYAYFIGGGADNVEHLAELENLQGCPGIKVFLGSSFGHLLVDDDQIFKRILKNGKKRVVIHSEDEARLKIRKQIAIDSGKVSDHPIWRDEESAMISTKKSIQFAREAGRSVHMLHISSSEEMAFLKQHKDICSVEILPQYLTLSAPECYERLGTLAQQNPPIRDKRHLEYLWKAVLDGTVDIIGSDHAPHTLEEKQKPYPQSPSGVPGVQTLAPIMLNLVHQNKLSLEKFVELTTENPRRIFNIQHKGRVEVGYDADFTVVDLQKTNTISRKWLQSKVDWSPFENMKVTGWPVMTLLKGEIVMQDEELLIPHCGERVEFK